MKLKKYLKEIHNMSYKEYKDLPDIERYNIWFYHQDFCRKEQKRKKENWRPMTEEEKEYLERIFQKEKEKFERDSKCGGIDSRGYVRLHDRYSE